MGSLLEILVALMAVVTFALAIMDRWSDHRVKSRKNSSAAAVGYDRSISSLDTRMYEDVED